MEGNDELDYSEEQMQQDIKRVKQALEAFLESKFTQANEYLNENGVECVADRPYIMLGKAMFTFFQAAMSFSKEEFQSCLAFLGGSIHEVKHPKYSRNLIEHFSAMLVETSVKKFTIVEKHIELIYSQLVIIRAITKILFKDTGILTLIKELVKVRTSYFAYRSCYHWLQNKGLLHSPEFKDLFSMTAFGMGVFNIMGSLVTPRVRDTCHIVGFDGNRELGALLLHQGYECDGVMSAGCRLAYKIFYAYIAQLFEIRVPKEVSLPDLVDEDMKRYPIGIYSSFIYGRSLMGQQKINDALSIFNRSLFIEYDLPAATHFQRWDIMMIQLSLGKIEDALESATFLYEHSSWSKSFFAYVTGICYLMFQNHQKANEFFAIVPKERRILAGKKIPFEKMVCKKVEKYNISQTLPAPHYELCLFWNFFKYLDQTQLQRIIDYVDCENVNVNNPLVIDDVSLIKFIKASCLKYMKEYDKSCEMFKQLMKSKPKFDAYLMPMAHAEYAHIMILTNRPSEAEYYFKKCLGFSGYSFTNYVQTRAYNYMNLL